MLLHAIHVTPPPPLKKKRFHVISTGAYAKTCMPLATPSLSMLLHAIISPSDGKFGIRL